MDSIELKAKGISQDNLREIYHMNSEIDSDAVTIRTSHADEKYDDWGPDSGHWTSIRGANTKLSLEYHHDILRLVFTLESVKIDISEKSFIAENYAQILVKRLED